MPQNLLKNGGFEADWGDERSHRCLVFPEGAAPYTTDIENILTPPGWVVWFHHKPGTWDQPEVRDAWQQSDPHRVHSGRKGILLFTFYRGHDAGFLQQVRVTPGTRLRLTAWAHAWSNHKVPGYAHYGNARCSVGVGCGPVYILEGQAPPLNRDPLNDAIGNFTFWVGIDPTGGTNPLAGTVVWGKGAHIYNEYHQVPAVEVTAQGDTLTVFLRSKTLWAFENSDAYWDDAELTVVGEQPQPPPTPPGGNTAWAYPVVAKGSKIGVHSLRPASVRDWARQLSSAGTCFPVVKSVDDIDWLVELKRESPQTITIARLHSSFESCHEINAGGDLNSLAGRLVDLVLRKISMNNSLRKIDYWEICNEPVPDSVQSAVRLCAVMFRCMELAEANGLKLGLFSLCAGTPEWDQMVSMVNTGVFGKAKQGGHILCLHEGVFGNDPIDKWWGERIPGSPVVEGAGALCFRYRYLYHLLKQRNEVIPLVVSEIVYGGGYGAGATATIVERARWYDEIAREDYYVLGHLPFTVGPVGSWEQQDYSPAYPELMRYMISVKDLPNGMPAQPPPQERGKPRTQYERVYVLLPPDANAAWAAAALDATWNRSRYTVGSSADDAGIGDLDNRRVIAVNPTKWPGDLRAFFETYYPGVNYTPVEAATPAELARKLKQL